MKTAGMILAAGLGTRMRPLSDDIPKPLLPVLGTPLISVIHGKLLREGATEIHANVHHLHRSVEAHVRRTGAPLTLHVETGLLGTGGGIGNMAAGIDADLVLLHNGDVISSAGYGPAAAHHLESGALFTMILMPGASCPERSCPPPHVLADSSLSVTGFDATGRPTPPGTGRFGYTGMSLISREGMSCFPRGEAYALTGLLGRLVSERPGSVRGFVAEKTAWAETGSPSAYLMLHRRIMTRREYFDPLIAPPPLPIFAGEGARIDPGAKWKGFLCAGRDSVIMEGTMLEDCVVLDGTVVEKGVSARDAILFRGGIVEGED